MNSFTYYAPTKVVFGLGAEAQAGQLCRDFGATKVLVHFGGQHAVRSGLIDRICASLDEAGLPHVELGGVVPNPRLSLVHKGLELAKAEGVDFTAGFYRVKVYADYGKMVDNGDGTWSYWTWLRAADGSWSFREAVRGEGTLVRDADGNWRFVDPDAPKASGSLYRDPDGDWKFVK